MGEVLDGGFEAELLECLTGDAITALGPVAEGEERLVAAGPCARRRDLDGLVHG